MVRIITINIRFDNPADGEHRWRERLPVLAQVLNSYTPDLVLTQEGWHRQLLELEECLDGLRLLDDHREWIEERMYPCIFARPDSYGLRVRRSGDVWLSETPYVEGSVSFGSAFPRLMTWCELTCRDAIGPLMIANLHLDHEARDTRIAQARVAANELSALNSQGLPVVLAGDFNDAPDSPVRHKITARLPHLYDPWTRRRKPESGSYHAFWGELPDAKRIDWILLDNRLAAGQILLDTRSHEGRYPSDHFPLVCDFSL